MSRVSTYLNFAGSTEEAFAFYGQVFGTRPGPVTRMRDMPAPPGAPALPESEQDAVMHVELEILAGHVLMGTDALESMGQTVRVGNNTTINLEVDTAAEATRLYRELADGGSEAVEVQAMPWGHWGCVLDRYGIRWMFNAPAGS